METFGTITTSSMDLFAKCLFIFGALTIAIALIFVSCSLMLESYPGENRNAFFTGFLFIPIGCLIFMSGAILTATFSSSNEKTCTANNIKTAIVDNYSDAKFLSKEIETEGYFTSKHQTYGYKVSNNVLVITKNGREEKYISGDEY